MRDLSANIARYMRDRRIADYATITHGAGIAGLDAEACAQAMAEGALLGLYRFDRHKKPDDDAFAVETMRIVENDNAKAAALQRAVERGVDHRRGGVLRARSGERARQRADTDGAGRARRGDGADVGLGCKIFDRADVEEMGMGSFLGVAQGSAQPPQFIMLAYQGGVESKPLGLVGKGITFDTGGISIKPTEGMQEMKGDMSGGGAVIAAMRAIARLKPKINVTALVPATENMPSGTAIKPATCCAR